jgi:hypothetical protein
MISKHPLPPTKEEGGLSTVDHPLSFLKAGSERIVVRSAIMERSVSREGRLRHSQQNWV